MVDIRFAVAVFFWKDFLDVVVSDLMEGDEIGPSLLEILNKLGPALLNFHLLLGTEVC